MIFTGNVKYFNEKNSLELLSRPDPWDNLARHGGQLMNGEVCASPPSPTTDIRVPSLVEIITAGAKARNVRVTANCRSSAVLC